MMSRLYKGGLMKGTDNSVWLYASVPMEAVTSAKSRRASVAAGDALANVYQSLAELVPSTGIKRRSLNRSSYRETHLLLLNTPQQYEPPKGHPNYAYWLRNYGGVQVDNRVLLFGVRLNSKIGGASQSYKESLSSFVGSLVDGETPIEDFAVDAKKISEIFRENALDVPTKQQVDMANGYWDHEQNPDVVVLAHEDHMHFFNDGEGIRIATAAGKENCENWLDESTWQDGSGKTVLPGESSLSFSVLAGLEIPDDTSSAASISNWVSNAMYHNTRVVSVRAKVEPCINTYTELRTARKLVNSEIEEAYKYRHMDKAQVAETEARLVQLDSIYSSPDGPSTLIDVTVIIGTEGVDSGRELRIPGLKTSPALHRQPAAWYETMLCSGTICQPRNDDFSIPVIANSGIQSLSQCGEDGGGALLGFTETDRQPVYISATVASDENSLPLMLVAGQTGSGKSMAMLHLADQWAHEGRPQVIIDPKRGSFHDTAIIGDGHNDNVVVPLGSLTSMDGIFDPIRFSAKGSEEEFNDAISLAVRLLLEIDPWPSVELARSFEPILPRIIRYGVIQGGADCIGEALEYALVNGKAPASLVDPVIDYAENDPYFRSMCGLEHGGKSLSVGNGITYIRVGNTNIGTPAAGVTARTLVERTACALVRMMVFASSAAVSGRSGVVHLDEAWIFLQSNPGEIDKLARLARSQLIFPILYTQKVSDALNADIHGAIGRTLIMSIKDRKEARYACQLIEMEETEARLSRITALGVMGAKGKTPNPNSMRPLYNPESPREVMRGAIGIYNDFSGRAANVEITIAPEFLAKASTNPLDIKKRKALAEAEEQAAVNNFARRK
jgi:hypothetical protein